MSLEGVKVGEEIFVETRYHTDRRIVRKTVKSVWKSGIVVTMDGRKYRDTGHEIKPGSSYAMIDRAMKITPELEARVEAQKRGGKMREICNSWVRQDDETLADIYQALIEAGVIEEALE